MKQQGTINTLKTAHISLTVIAERLGRANALGTYANATPSQQAEAAAVMDTVMIGGL
jgi:hypothetical protein